MASDISRNTGANALSVPCALLAACTLDTAWCLSIRYFSDYDQPAYPTGISALAKVLLTSWICGKYMSKILQDTILNPRSSVCES